MFYTGRHLINQNISFISSIDIKKVNLRITYFLHDNTYSKAGSNVFKKYLVKQ